MIVPKAASRNLGLDLLRLLAILLVLSHHLRPSISGKGGLFVATLIKGGWVGVDLFFVLSGYLVAGLLFKEYAKEGRVSLRNFLIRRGFKIYPAFWILIGCSAVVFAPNGRPTTPQDLFGEFLFVQNYAAHIWPHTWSLAIEEHFYLLLVAVMWLMLRSKKPHALKPFPRTFFIVATACLAFRAVNALRYPEYDFTRDYFPTHLRIDSLFFGAFLAYLAQYHQLERRLRWFSPWARIAAGTLLLAPAFIFARETHRWISIIGFNLFYLGAGLLVLGALHLQNTPFRPLRMLGRLGAASYSIYLWHYPVHQWFATPILFTYEHNPGFYWQYAGVAVIGAVLFGYVMALVVELPVLLLRDRLFPTKSGPATAVDSPQKALPIPEKAQPQSA